TVVASGTSMPAWAVTTGTLRTGAAISGSGGLSVASGATFQPGGGPGIGTVNLTGALSLAGNTAVDVSRASADRISANGGPAGGPLGVTVGTAPANGASFTIIDNTSANPVSGTFSGLPEGSTIIGTGLKISYVGGDGNDVTLTAPDVPGAPTIGTATGGPG